AEFHPPVDGRSLWPTLQGRHPADWRDETFSELMDVRGGEFPSRMIRSGKWKLWTYADEEHLPAALFDLDSDPDELRDLGRQRRFADVRDVLLGRVRDGWDPEAMVAETRGLWESRKTLVQWARTVRPDNPDQPEIPPAEYEADVELL
ncbi:unnamed protein product, partial [marine sediment metagenome]